MSVNKGFSFRAPKVPGTNSIEHLSFDDFYEMSLAGMPLPAFPSRTLKQLVVLVDKGKTAEISVLEWLDVIENEHHWAGLSSDERNNACRAIWLAICTNEILGNIAFFKAGLAVEGFPTTMVKPLLSTMDIVRHVPGLNQLDADRIDWLTAVKRKDWNGLAQACHQHSQAPRKRVKKLMLPNANSYVIKLPSHLVDVLPRSLEPNDERWLEQCFGSFKTAQQKVAFFNALINKYCDRLYRGECKSLLEQSCLPESDDSLWYELENEARSKLKSVFSISSYYELSMLSKRLCEEATALQLGIEEQQRNQIYSRTQFWSNYSERFNRIRAILPELTYQLLANKGVQLSQQISTFKQPSDTNVEVFIFELDRILVVEILRGDLGETRFFKSTEWNAMRLLEGEFDSLADIRELPQLEVHDHVLLWQYFCEKMLRTKFRVKPNDGIEQFAGLSWKFGQYIDGKGLPKPGQSVLVDREAMLEQWVEMFWRHEFNTSKYGQQSGLQQRSNVYLFKAQVAKQTGNEENHDLYVKKAANQGNPEAMWLLGSKLLLSANSTPKNRGYGESWIVKAAQAGHKKALEAVKRFGIEIKAQPKGDDTRHATTSSEATLGLSKNEWDEKNRTRSQYLKDKHGSQEKKVKAVDIVFKKKPVFASEQYSELRERHRHISKEEWTANNRARSQHLRAKHKK